MLLLFTSDIDYFAPSYCRPFTILKAGPTRVEQTAPFNFEVTVVFARAASDSLFSASSYLQAPFTILKAGPTRVEQNAPFNFEVTVVFMSSVTAARIVDNLPPGLWPTGTATWTAISNNGVPSGSECGLLCVFHNSHSMWWPAVRT